LGDLAHWQHSRCCPVAVSENCIGFKILAI
jgi:hypothetical protein